MRLREQTNIFEYKTLHKKLPQTIPNDAPAALDDVLDNELGRHMFCAREYKKPSEV